MVVMQHSSYIQSSAQAMSDMVFRLFECSLRSKLSVTCRVGALGGSSSPASAAVSFRQLTINNHYTPTSLNFLEATVLSGM